jgi:hypothetical protein
MCFGDNKNGCCRRKKDVDSCDVARMKFKVRCAHAGTRNGTRVTRCTTDEGQDVDDSVKL